MRFLLPLLCLAILLTGCGSTSDLQKIALVGPDNENVMVDIEVADTADERAKGLMDRTSLPQNQGMLFLFSEADYLSFWMKNTYVSLDIIFFSPQGEFIGTDSMVPCEEDPCLRYTSTGPASIALEVNAGFVKKHNIGPGWRIALPIE